MKIAWGLLLVRAILSFILTGGAALVASIVAVGNQRPSEGVVIVALVTGLMAAATTMQHALEMTPDTLAILKGIAPPTSAPPSNAPWMKS